jgi:two-component system OmpR family response regulator
MTTRLLLVEDDPDIRVVAEMCLVELGSFAVMSVGSGREALAVAASFVPEVVLLDVIMPDLDGATTLRALRALPELATTPVIFVTAQTQRKERAALMSLGALGIIDKPFDPLQLAAQVRALLEGARPPTG